MILYGKSPLSFYDYYQWIAKCPPYPSSDFQNIAIIIARPKGTSMISNNVSNFCFTFTHGLEGL